MKGLVPQLVAGTRCRNLSPHVFRPLRIKCLNEKIWKDKGLHLSEGFYSSLSKIMKAMCSIREGLLRWQELWRPFLFFETFLWCLIFWLKDFCSGELAKSWTPNKFSFDVKQLSISVSFTYVYYMQMTFIRTFPVLERWMQKLSGTLSCFYYCYFFWCTEKKRLFWVAFWASFGFMYNLVN